MAFDETPRFPDDISLGSKGGPEFSTAILQLASGYEKRNQNWIMALHRYNIAYGIKDAADMDVVRAFFFARGGRFRGFRIKDWADYTVGATTLSVAGDGIETDFQLEKQYTSGSITYVRNLIKPISGTLSGVTVNAVPQTEGVDFTVDYTTGIMTFGTPPGSGHAVAITALEFDVPVRFDTDMLDVEHEFWEIQSVPNIPITEIRDAT